jgi:protein-disulfide isomerase
MRPSQNSDSVVFSAFQCPFCKDSADLFNQVAASEGDKVRIIFRHLPLTAIHPWARPAAEAAACLNSRATKPSGDSTT